LKHLRKTLTDPNCVHEEIKRRLNSGNAGTVGYIILCLPICKIHKYQFYCRCKRPSDLLYFSLWLWNLASYIKGPS